MKINILYPLLALSITTPAFAESVSLKHELTPKTIEQEVEIHAYKDSNGATVTEHRLHGKVWMIKVQPAGNFPAYYLYDHQGNGNFERRIAGNKQPSPPMWIIKKF
ncbi:MAG: DUF2782 domain-containing protein [Ghiorsea sp.]